MHFNIHHYSAHDFPNWYEIQGHEDPGDFVEVLHYIGGFEFIRRIADLSPFCKQYVGWNCTASTIHVRVHTERVANT